MITGRVEAGQPYAQGSRRRVDQGEHGGRVGDLLLILAANAGVTRSADRVERSRRPADPTLAGLGLSPER